MFDISDIFTPQVTISNIKFISDNFKPQVSDESCDPFEWGSAAKAFWQGVFDKSCFLKNFF